MGGAAPGQEVAPATLKKGWNAVLIGVTQNVAGWGFYFSVADPQGAPRNDIYLADSPRESEREQAPLPTGPWYVRWFE